MNCCVATLCSPAHAPIGAITHPNKQAYCDRHGYHFKVKSDGFQSHIAFERFRFFLDCLRECDLVLGCGADVIITNPEITLESLAEGRRPFLICKDANGYQSDVILARNHPDAIAFLEKIVGCEAQYVGAPQVDQTALEDFCPTCQAVQVMPQRFMNSFDYTVLYHLGGRYAIARDADMNDGQWHPGDFILHTPGLFADQKMALLRKHL